LCCVWSGELPLQLYFPILEEMARCHGSIRMRRTSENGSEEQQLFWLLKEASGEAQIAFALTEPDNGTGEDLR